MKKQFATESKRILDLMIHSIYTNKEIFLRELISNASDALDKRYISELNKGESFDRSNFYIEIKFNKEKRILEIIDNGIGMTRQELENNLGVIAKSGSLDFKKNIKSEDVSIIGQFGVGFYSAFMVSDKIEVITKSFSGEGALMWSSEGTDGYEIEEVEKEDIGTAVRLFIKEKEDEEDEYDLFLDQYYLKDLVQKYSNYIKYPIKMEMLKTKAKNDDPKNYEVEEYHEYEVLNSMTPIWNKQKTLLKDQDYIDFYREQRYGFDDPLKWVHLNAEGLINYRAILYIPSEKPFDYYSKDFKRGLELYSNGVMIMERNEELLPEYLSFVKGVVDSEDLSLNISREILQKDRRLLSIAKNVEKKIISELKNMLKNEREKYEKFYESFGLSIKAGIYSGFGNKKAELQDLLLFKSSKSEESVTLEEYVSNMPESQEYIYYATGENYDKISKLPQLQKMKSEGKEILYLDQDIDEFVIKMLISYKDKNFKSVFDEDIEGTEEGLDEGEKKNREELFNRMKNILEGEVIAVKEGTRLVDDAACLISKGEISIEMEKTLSMQPDAPKIKAEKILELNPKHPIFEKLMQALSKNDEEKIALISRVLYNQSRLIAGLKIEDVVEYTQDTMKLMNL